MITDFDKLKADYIASVRLGISLGANHEEAKRGNNILHNFCENIVENSRYNTETKHAMKYELEILKEILSREIDTFYMR